MWSKSEQHTANKAVICTHNISLLPFAYCFWHFPTWATGGWVRGENKNNPVRSLHNSIAFRSAVYDIISITFMLQTAMTRWLAWVCVCRGDTAGGGHTVTWASRGKWHLAGGRRDRKQHSIRLCSSASPLLSSSSSSHSNTLNRSVVCIYIINGRPQLEAWAPWTGWPFTKVRRSEVKTAQQCVSILYTYTCMYGQYPHKCACEQLCVHAQEEKIKKLSWSDPH